MAQGSGCRGGDPADAGQVCLSNRKANRPKTGQTQVRGVGIDRLSVSFPVADFDRDEAAWDSISVRQPGTFEAAKQLAKTNVPGVRGVSFIGVQEVPRHPVCRWWGKVEGNPSRLVDPEGISLCPVDELPVVVRRMAMVAGEFLEPGGPVPSWSVKRVDVARDFEGVSGGPQLVRSLGALPRAWARRNFVHADAQKHGAQTLSVGSGSGMARLYDLHAAHGAPVGSLRAEAECRTRWLRSYGAIRTVSDLTDSNINRLMLDRWEWSALGAEVASSVAALVDVVLSAGLSVPVRQRFIGWLVEQAAGVAVGEVMHTGWRYRALQKELGIVVAPDVLETEGAVWRRLDLDSGTEVVRVA